MLCVITVSACNRETNDYGSPELFLSKALEAAKQGRFGEVDNVTEHAAQQGNLCAMALMAEISNPETRLAMADSFDMLAVALYSIDWLNVNKRKARFWASVFVDSLQLRAEKGEADPALWLARVYDGSASFIPSPANAQPNDSLAAYWYQEAVDRGSNEALLMQAFREQGTEATRLMRQAALQGHAPAFARWAHRAQWKGNMHEYFEAADVAVERKVTGVHEWLKPDLEILAQQAEKGDSLALVWKSMADDLNLFERLAALPEQPGRQRFNTNSWLCGEEYKHINPEEL